MAIVGRKPKSDAERRNPNKHVHDWVEVQNHPFDGAPKLPRWQPNGMPWPKATKSWWAAISRMPHCVSWKDSDWQFATDTALLAAAFHAGDLRVAGELRLREKVMGTTADALRDLRIRYVDSTPDEEQLGITAIQDYKKRLTGRGR